MNKKVNCPAKEKQKLVLNLFKYDVAKKLGLTRDAVFLLRELLRWYSNCAYNVEDRAFVGLKGFKNYYLSLKIKSEEWFFTPKTLGDCINKLVSCGVIAKTTFQLKRPDNDKRTSKKYLGKKLYICFVPNVLKQLCAIDLPSNEKIKEFITSLEKLNPNYQALAQYQKQIKEKELVQVETLRKKGNTRYSGMTEKALDKNQKSIRHKMNNKSKPKTEGETKLDKNDYLTEEDIRNLPDEIMDEYCKRQAIESLRNEMKKGNYLPKDYYTNDDYLKDLDENFSMPVQVNPQYDTDVCVEDIVND